MELLIGPSWKDCHIFSLKYEGIDDVIQENFVEDIGIFGRLGQMEGVGAGHESEECQESLCLSLTSSVRLCVAL